MRIADILARPQVVPEVNAADKETALRVLTSHIFQTRDDLPVTQEKVLQALLDRERLGSTGVGEGVAIPHAKVAGLASLLACFARVRDGVPFDAIDRRPVHLIFVLLVPENSAGAHLKALARISRLLKNEAFRQQLLAQTDADAIYEAFLQEDSKY